MGGNPPIGSSWLPNLKWPQWSEAGFHPADSFLEVTTILRSLPVPFRKLRSDWQEEKDMVVFRLFLVYKGMKSYPCYVGIVKDHEIRSPIKQPGWLMESIRPVFFFVAQVDNKILWDARTGTQISNTSTFFRLGTFLWTFIFHCDCWKNLRFRLMHVIYSSHR